MRQWIRGCAAGAILTTLVAGGAQAVGGHAGSAEDQLACTSDVYRFCAAQIPDEDAIVTCLKAHKAGLSEGCGRVFSRPAGSEEAVPQDDE